MVTILIVDDDVKKQQQIRGHVEECLQPGQVQSTCVASAHEAVAQLMRQQFDLMVLDFNLPVKVGDQPRKDGGIQVLQQLLKRGRQLFRPMHILALTAYPDLQVRFTNDFRDEAWQIVTYDATSEEWANAVRNKVIHIAEASAGMADSTDGYKTDLAIVTALKDLELGAVLQLDAEWEEQSIDGDDTIYHVGMFERDGRALSVVAASALEMGMAASACLTMKVIEQFRPRVVAMVGVAAGIGCQYGDVVVAEQSWDYGSGKIWQTETGADVFSPSPNYLDLDAGIKEKIASFISQRRDVIAGIQARWPGNPVNHVLNVLLRPVASGAAVLENKGVVGAIQGHNRKVAAVEMETYGVFFAGKACTEPRPVVMSAKAVCDFGAPPKTDEYQRYAAFTSANFVFELALARLSQPII